MIDWSTAVLAPLQGVFGEAVTHLPASGGSYPVTGIFDQAYREVDLAGGMAVTTEHPLLGIEVAAWPLLPLQGDRITVLRLGQNFIVREVELDGHGGAKLLLNEST